MFTVIICDKRIISDCQQKYAIYFKPFLTNNEIAFCEWNVGATTFEESLPGLKKMVEKIKEWRAIIVNDIFTWDQESVNKLNPFDYVDSQVFPNELTTVDDILRFREARISACEKAINNPLVRVASWLCGTQIINCPRTEYLSLLSNEVDEMYLSQLSERALIPIDVEIDRYRTYKYELLSKHFLTDGELFNLPTSVVTIAERTKDVSSEILNVSWKKKTEFDYSSFYLDNLYPSKLRYILYDLPHKNGVRNENSYFSFLNIILMLAHFDYPNESIRANRVYKICAELDTEKIGELFQRYNSKLFASLVKIDELEMSISNKINKPVDKKLAKDIFESEARVPVAAYTNSIEQELYCKYNTIGLSKDCPCDENHFWNEQFHSILSKFIRFLREPRRALKTSVRYDFRNQATIDDERALSLNEFQIEDLEIKLLDEEQKMIESTTVQLYDNDKYKKKLEEANKEINRAISQRMTKRKTLFVGLTAIIAYLIGFFPLLISNWNNTRSLTFSFWVTVIVLVLFAVCGIVTLFVLRKRLINRFKHFNYVMSGIFSEIEKSLEDFSKYLSHACNVMREFFVLNYIKDGSRSKYNVLNYHRSAINHCINQTKNLFAEFVSDNMNRHIIDTDPYDYDFTKKVPYEFDIPYSLEQNLIVFMQTGNEVNAPVDYIKSITLTREELYD